MWIKKAIILLRMMAFLVCIVNTIQTQALNDGWEFYRQP